MNSRPSVLLAVFVVGVAVGAAASYAILSFRQQEHAAHLAAETASAAAAAAQVDELTDSLASAERLRAALEQDNLTLGKRVQELMQQAASSTPVAAAVPAARKRPANPFAAMFGGDDADGTNQISQAMQGMMQAALKNQIEGKLSLMKSRLNLTPEQEASIRALLEKQMGAGVEMAQKMMAGETSMEDLAAAQQAQLTPDQKLEDLLTPEQLPLYESLQVEERQNQARLVANAEMLQMQNTLGLTQEQQDQVFQVLYQQTEQQLNPETFRNTTTAFSFRDTLDRKVEALRPVLNPGQLQRYREMQEQQLKLIEAFAPAAGAGGDAVIPNVQVLTTP